MQLVLAGKAHPADVAGQSLIQQWVHFTRRPEARAHVVFLSDYDMDLTQNMVQGVDVWLNTPQRPWEACGTSGMKVLVNGGINLSELDGWWAEAYSPDVGWALGDGQEHGYDPAWHRAEALALYDLLEQEVIPQFYNRGENGIPALWIARMRESMARLTPRFSASRAVREYTEKHYLPAADAYQKRAADHGALGKELIDWKRSLDEKWPGLHFGAVNVQQDADQLIFDVSIYLNGIPPTSVRIELYADGQNGVPPVRHLMGITSQDRPDVASYSLTVSANRPASDYTVRAIPCAPGAATLPLEETRILWQR